MNDTDEWVKTPNGHYKGQVDLDEEVIATYINHWAMDNLDDASFEQYQEILAASGSQEKALHAGLVNKLIIDSLTEMIEREEGKS